MSLHEIVLRETTPESEWVRGRALQKVSPTYRHGFAQMRFASALEAWSQTHHSGRVATEWRFRVQPPGEIVRPLVPDVAYLSFTTLAEDAREEDVATPNVAPTIAIEVVSPDDRDADVSHKIAVYLAAGTSAVILVDPIGRYVVVHDPSGTRRVLGSVFTHEALPGFSLGIATLFPR